MDAIKKIIVLFLGAAGWITVVVMNLGFRDRDYSLGMEYLWLTIVLWGVALLLASLRGGYRD